MKITIDFSHADRHAPADVYDAGDEDGLLTHLDAAIYLGMRTHELERDRRHGLVSAERVQPHCLYDVAELWRYAVESRRAVRRRIFGTDFLIVNDL